MAAASSSRLVALAKSILANAEKIEHHCAQNELPVPSFDEHAAPDAHFKDASIDAARTAAIDASEELRDLLIGPTMCLRPVLNATSLHAIYSWDIAGKVPRDGRITYAELAQACDLQEHDVRRIVSRVFQEKETGYVSHSAASRYLADSKESKAGLGMMFDECYQGFAHTVEAFRRNKNPGPGESGWSTAQRVDMPMWEYYALHPDKGERTALAMASFAKGSGHDISSLVTGYEWASLNAKSATVVDVGGGNGHASIAVARQHPALRFVVQDLPVVLNKATIPADVAGRVELAVHDFFKPQPVAADVYLLRQILHDWNDTYCLDILRALVPALKPGAKVVCNDFLVPPPGVLPPSQEKHIRAMDMIVMTLFNAREREEQDWQALFKEADARFGDVKAWKPEGSTLGIIEATWAG